MALYLQTKNASVYFVLDNFSGDLDYYLAIEDILRKITREAGRRIYIEYNKVVGNKFVMFIAGNPGNLIDSILKELEKSNESEQRYTNISVFSEGGLPGKINEILNLENNAVIKADDSTFDSVIQWY